MQEKKLLTSCGSTREEGGSCTLKRAVEGIDGISTGLRVSCDKHHKGDDSGVSMQLMKFWIVVAIAAMLAACATVTEQQLKLAQQSVQKGDYAHAFDQAARSLTAKIDNYQTMQLFVAISQHAYADKLAEIGRYKALQSWDQVAYGYDRITSMNQTIRQLQQTLIAFAGQRGVAEANQGAVNSVLAMKTIDVGGEHSNAYERAAAGHYAKAKALFTSRSYRQARAAFSKSLAFIDPYKDARAQLLESGHLADLADAQMYYGQAVDAVEQQRYREASLGFAKAYSFIPDFRDARQLAEKYKYLADQDDALIYYQKANALAQSYQYRSAAQAFNQALSFVPDFRDARKQSLYYTGLANRAEAKGYYTQAMDLMDEQRYSRAASAFEQANNIVPGFRDAEFMAEKARSMVAPEEYELKRLVQQSVQKGIPLSWLDDVHQGYAEEVVVTGVNVQRRGYFNEHNGFWPYKLHVRGTYTLEVGNAKEQALVFDTVVDYRIFRDDFGDWKATFH